ncbi:MAG: thiolase family protein [Syntrophales bacterium]|jgi:acetyl-CoA C-acetyltransferase|nr:thiolase family protein [Syntrophales bacterium]MDX9922879.1 thiolase family protein [Syntrophales bacterium]
MEKREVVFVEGKRTAIGRLGGSLKDFTAEELGTLALKGLVDKTEICARGVVDSVFAGSAFHVARAINPARWILLNAGLPVTTTASYVEMQCGSSIDGINHAAWKILCGHADTVIVGGMESFSQLPFKFSSSTPPYRITPPELFEYQLQPTPKEGRAYAPFDMGMTAENLQVLYNISREEQDEFAFRSQTLARKAIDAGYFEHDIVPVMISRGKKEPPFEFKVDEHPRLSSLQDLAKLRPAFKKDGTVTAGNASGLNDGSAFILMMAEETALELDYKPVARWICGAEYGVDPSIMGIAPAHAIPRALKRAKLNLADIDVIECNEAFAVQNLAVIRELEKQTGEKVSMDKWNPLGGAIAFGHPNGASGARCAMFAMGHLVRTGGRYGLFSACCGGGLGVVTIIENLQT